MPNVRRSASEMRDQCGNTHSDVNKVENWKELDTDGIQPRLTSEGMIS